MMAQLVPQNHRANHELWCCSEICTWHKKKLLTKLLNLDGSSKGLYSLQSFQVRIKTLELMTDGTEVSSIYPFQSHALTHPQGSCLWSYLSRAWSSADDPGELIDKAMPFFMGCLHCQCWGWSKETGLASIVLPSAILTNESTSSLQGVSCKVVFMKVGPFEPWTDELSPDC